MGRWPVGLRVRGLWRIPLQRGKEDRGARARCREVPTLREEDGFKKGRREFGGDHPKEPCQSLPVSPTLTWLHQPVSGQGLCLSPPLSTSLHLAWEGARNCSLDE